jgi:S-adenosyl-L-methionine hydrolase (adenosine-forming)
MLITLLSDLGTKDAAAAAARAALMHTIADAEVVDISHGVSRHNWREAAYLLSTAYNTFPQGTVHLIPVAVFTERQPRMIMAKKEGYYFIAPDNGLLTAALGIDTMTSVWLCHQYAKPYNFTQWLSDAAALIHTLPQGEQLLKAGYTLTTQPPLPPPHVTPINVVCRALYADRYNNIVVNITQKEFDNLQHNRQFKIRTFKGQNITSVSRHYNDVAIGEPLCRFNKAGFLEVAVNHGSALELFGLEKGDTTALDYHTVRINFNQ